MKKRLFLSLAFISACGGGGGLPSFMESSLGKESFIRELELKKHHQLHKSGELTIQTFKKLIVFSRVCW
jgi:hypothetical protein